MPAFFIYILITTNIYFGEDRNNISKRNTLIIHIFQQLSY